MNYPGRGYRALTAAEWGDMVRKAVDAAVTTVTTDVATRATAGMSTGATSTAANLMMTVRMATRRFGRAFLSRQLQPWHEPAFGGQGYGAQGGFGVDMETGRLWPRIWLWTAGLLPGVRFAGEFGTEGFDTIMTTTPNRAGLTPRSGLFQVLYWHGTAGLSTL